MQQAKILVVEDDPDIMRILVQCLTTGGHQVVQAYGAEDALRKVEAQRFDLILTDLAMPKMSGVELIYDLKNNPQRKKIPVLAVTAHVWDAIAQSALRVGCNGIISKPFNTKQLLQEVHKHLQPAGE